MYGFPLPSQDHHLQDKWKGVGCCQFLIGVQQYPYRLMV